MPDTWIVHHLGRETIPGSTQGTSKGNERPTGRFKELGGKRDTKRWKGTGTRRSSLDVKKDKTKKGKGPLGQLSRVPLVHSQDTHRMSPSFLLVT